MIGSVKRRYDEGLRKGLAEGMEKGIAEGMQQGEEKERLKIARSMKADGMLVESIARYTGIAPEIIEKL